MRNRIYLAILAVVAMLLVACDEPAADVPEVATEAPSDTAAEVPEVITGVPSKPVDSPR